jgi:hypothetical protein
MGDGCRKSHFSPKRRSSKSEETSNHKGVHVNHKGVHVKARSNKFVARLCLPGGKNRKLDLGEYNSHDAAARAYQVGAFYYNKPLDSISEQGQSLVDSLPYIPGNLSDADKLIWVREQARQYATSERASTLQQAQATPTLPTTSECAAHQYSFLSYEELQSGALKLDPFEDSQVWNFDAIPSDAMKRLKRLETISSSRVELQVGRTAPDQVPASELRMTDTIFAAQCELRKQGWGWTVKLQSMSSLEAGVLFSLPRTQQAAPALVMTGSIISAFQEVCEQGWEVRLEPSKCDNL